MAFKEQLEQQRFLSLDINFLETQWLKLQIEVYNLCINV